MSAFKTLLGNTDRMAYLAMMAPRLVELRRVLKDTGSNRPRPQDESIRSSSGYGRDFRRWKPSPPKINEPL